MEEQFNREAKKGWKFATSAARITEEMAGDDDSKHSSKGVFDATDSNLGAVGSAEEGAIGSIPGNEGRIAQTWVNVKRRTAYLLSQSFSIPRSGRQEMNPYWIAVLKELGPQSIHG